MTTAEKLLEGTVPQEKLEARREKLLDQARREKYWSEIEPDEKCKRLRQIVKSLDARLGVLERQLHELQHHEHSAQGLMAPIHCGPVDQPERSGRHKGPGDDVYF